MQKLYDFYAENLPLSTRQAQPKPADSFVVLMTGSTGSLGSYILDSLVREPRVSRIYCLNRGHSGLERQKKSQATKGLRPLSEKVQCLDVDLSKPYFGLSTQVYTKLLREVTTVIHSAWRVDFNLSIDSFKSHIGIVRSFIDFSAHSSFGAHIFFVSSLSAVSNWHSATGQKDNIREQIYEDWRIPEAIGYGNRSSDVGVPAVVCRVGQVAGPTAAAGIWPKQEWLPSLIASSKHLGKLPSSLGQMDMVDWVPVDVAAQSIAELATGSTISETSAGVGVYHVVNPRQTTWASLVPTIVRHLDTGNTIKVVQLKEWVSALRESAPVTEDISQNPAIKLLDFFEGLASKIGDPVRLDTKEAVGRSPALASLGPIQDGMVENWMRQWDF
ncbi:male sterility protein-domain-containing protein [Biscogniauxia marginata]|nr:male sterility protein-domain-containing protein [Biscogniauxia marginata]